MMSFACSKSIPFVALSVAGPESEPGVGGTSELGANSLIPMIRQFFE